VAGGACLVTRLAKKDVGYSTRLANWVRRDT
jgi:hypothetical protein